MKNIKIRLIIAIFLISVLSLSVMAADDTQYWPDSWFEEPRTASELGIDNFNQSPVLADKVEAGELAAAAERLPEDPIVVEPLDEIGKYGGTAVTFTTSNYDTGDGGILNPVEGLVRPCPRASKILPSYAEDYEISDDATKLTFYLREGIKWSDGHRLTSEDFLYWWEYEANNSDINPVPPSRWTPVGIEDVIALDDYTVQYVFEGPNPLAINKFIMERTLGDNYGWVQPAHHLKNYHKDFISEEEMQQKMEEHSFDQWMQYYNYGKDTMDPEVGYPMLTAYVVAEKSANMYLYKRNPYYPKVDTAGNQLPYIDEIQIHIVQDQEMMTGKALTGEATVAGTQTKTTDIPLFKQSEQDGEYITYLWNRVMGTDVVIQFNLNHPDEELRNVFQDLRFRQAMSLAINREEINNNIYYGHGTPRQTTVIPSSKYFEERFADAYIEYSPKEANRLLDEVGLIDEDDDGLRELPDGDPLNITLEWTPMETPKGPTMELVVDYWKDVGIDVELKQINTSLQHERAHGNQMDMTLWHGDKLSDLMYPNTVPYLIPVGETWFETCMWRKWVQYYVTEGEKGWEPPREIKDLQQTWEEVVSTADEDKRIELGKKILEANAENLWTIGTVGLAPFPMIVSNELKNVPEMGYWGWDNRWSFGYHPETWYLEQ
ncbi:MAG: ABC transporter substrate-binding protein [Halanaerobiales bacterium]